MAKQENFDFETEKKFSLDLSFFKNLTPKQKEMILMITIGVIALIIIVVIGVVMITGNSGNGGNNSGGDVGGTGDNGGSENGDVEGDGTENGDTEGESPDMPTEILEFYIASPPTKTTYYVGEDLNYEGLFFYFRNSDDRSEHIFYTDDPDAFTITGFDSSVAAYEQVVTVTFGEFSDTFTVTIKDPEVSAPKLVSIHFGTYPRQVFSPYDYFEFETGVLVCTYSDESTVEIPLMLDYMYGLGNVFDTSGEYLLVPGEHTITVEYGEGGVFVQTEYTITVTE